MRALWSVAPLLASALIILALTPASEAQATILIPPTDFVPAGLGDGDQFRLLFVTSNTTDLVPTKTSYEFFNDFVQNAVSDNGPASLEQYAQEFRAVVSCGRAGAMSNTDTLSYSDEQIPIYWLEGDKVADNYGEFWTAGWDSNDPRDESGQATGTVLVWTGTTSTGAVVGISLGTAQDGGGLTVCSNTVMVGKPDTSEKEMNYFTMSSSSDAALYGLSPVFHVSSAPSVPTAPTVVSTTHNTARITWDAPAFHGATPISGYDVQVKRAGGSWTESTPNHRGTGTSHTITGLSSYTEYQVRVHAKNQGAGGSGTESGPWSATATFQTKTAFPSAPGQPVVQPHATSAHVSWTPPAWVGGPPLHDYDLRLRIPGGSWAYTGISGTDTSHTITGLSPNTEYQVHVHANNTSGIGPWSATTTFRTLSTDTPVGVTVPADWAMIPGGLGSGHSFRLLFVTDPPRFWTDLQDNRDLERLDGIIQGVVRDGHWGLRSYADHFQVLASCGGTDARHHTGTMYTSSDPGVPIYWVVGDRVADDYADFYDGSWDSLDARSQTGWSWDLHGYAAPMTWTGTNTDGTSSRHHVCTNPVTYGYADDFRPGEHFSSGTLESRHARALYGISEVFVVSNTPGAPGNLSISSITHHSAAVSWSAPARQGAAQIHDYDMTIRPATPGANVGVHGTGTTFTITGLNPDTTYHVQVRANNSFGSGPWSSTVTFHTLQTPTEVPSNWQLIPDGLGPGDVFRLLFVTSDTRPSVYFLDFRSEFPQSYHAFVRNAASSGHSALDSLSDEFLAVVSTRYEHALDNALMRHSTTIPGVPVYWLDGDKVADDYADFYDGCWDSNNPRDENGDDVQGNVWTGSQPNGTKHTNFIGHTTVRYGDAGVQCKEMSAGGAWADLQYHVYGISPVLYVSLVPSAPTAPTVVSVTHNTASITWSAPESSGATQIFDYNVQVRQAGGTWVQSTPYHWGTDTSHTLTGLSPDTEYQVRVYAKNHGAGGSETGYGPTSPPTTFHTAPL